MKVNFKKIICISALLLASSSVFADKSCATLTAKDVAALIDEGFIVTKQNYGLAEETGETKIQVMQEEPTANPFDTYYSMHDMRDGKVYLIGNVLGGSPYEAKDRAKKILLDGQELFFGTYVEESKACIYKDVHAENSGNYPFKSRYESVTLASFNPDDMQSVTQALKMKVHR